MTLCHRNVRPVRTVESKFRIQCRRRIEADHRRRYHRLREHLDIAGHEVGAGRVSIAFNNDCLRVLQIRQPDIIPTRLTQH